MRLDTETLSTFYEMARQGAGLAADRLTAMTGVESHVSATRIEFASPQRVTAELSNADEYSGTVVDLGGGLTGQTLLFFETDAALTIAQKLVDDIDGETERSTEHLVRSAVPELCAIMNNGFVDGWANVLDRDVTVSMPKYLPEESAAAQVDTTGEMALLFRSTIDVHDSEIEFKHYYIPGPESVEELFAAESGIEYRNLVGFDQVAQRGTDRVTEDLSQMTGMRTSIDVHTVSFLALDAIPEAVPNERVASVAFSFEGTPSGYLLFLYDKYSAGKLADAMVGTQPGEELGEMGRDAVKEASNIMASGLLDGWANALDTTIRHTVPAFTWDLGPAAVDPLVVGLSESREFAFVFDTQVSAADELFDLSMYVIPDEADFEQAVDEVEPERIGPDRVEEEIDLVTINSDSTEVSLNE